MSNSDSSKTDIKHGEFPFPLGDGPSESPYLTWLRNHSNYMAVRGFLDHLRAVGVLVRGIIVNFLIILPYLLIPAIVLGYFHHSMLNHPFLATMTVLSIALICILLFAFLTPIYKVFRYKKSIETGSESSVKTRDKYERFFGGLLLSIAVAALFESLPWLLESLHDVIHSDTFGTKGSLATLAGLLALLSGADKLLTALKGFKKKAAVALIGILGLLVPLLVILLTTDFLVYGVPPSPSTMFSPLLAPVLGVVCSTITLVYGWRRETFNRKERRWVAGLIGAGMLGVVVIVVVGSLATHSNFAGTEASLKKLIDPLDRVAKQFTRISNEGDMPPEVAELVTQIANVHRKYGRTIDDLEDLARRDKEGGTRTPGLDESPPVTRTAESQSTMGPTIGGTATKGNEFPVDEKSIIASWNDEWREFDEQSKRKNDQFNSGQEFITLGHELSALPRGSLDPLRAEIAGLAHDELMKEVKRAKLGSFDVFGGTSDVPGPQRSRQILAEQFVKIAVHRLVNEVWGDENATVFAEKWGVPDDPAFDHYQSQNESTDSGNDNDVFRVAGIDHPRGVWNYARALSRVLMRKDANFTYPEEAVEFAPVVGKVLLQERSVAELAKLADENRLRSLVSKKKTIGTTPNEIARTKAELGIGEFIGMNEIVDLLIMDSLSPEEPEEPEEQHPESLEQRERLLEFAQREVDKLALPGQKSLGKDHEPLTTQVKASIASELAILAQMPTSLSDQIVRAEQSLAGLSAQENESKQRIEEIKAKLKEIDKQIEGLDSSREQHLDDAKEATSAHSKQSNKQSDKAKLTELESQRSHEFDAMRATERILEFHKVRVRSATKQLEQLTKEQQIRKSHGETIQPLACEALANLVLEDFAVEFLGILAVLPDLYDWDFERCAKDLTALDFELDESARREFNSKKEVVELARQPDLATLVKQVFEDPLSGRGSTNILSNSALRDGTFPDVTRLLLAQRAMELAPRAMIEDTLADRIPEYNGPEMAVTEHDLVASRFIARRRLAKLAIEKLIEKSIDGDASESDESRNAREMLEKVYRYDQERLSRRRPESSQPPLFGKSELARIAVAKYATSNSVAVDKLVTTLMFGKYGSLERETLGTAKAELSHAVMLPKSIFLALVAVVIWLGCWLTVDVNLTSIHGLYRDRLASAFLIGKDTNGNIDIEEDVDLEDLCRYEACSIAPYHLVNVALNLQGSEDIGIRDRNSDFFIFSKRFIGGARTGYCRSETMEQVFPQMSLATAMAISAAAASPNMGRSTSPLLVAFMTLLNIRLGYWVPNPGLLEEQQDTTRWKQRKQDVKRAKQKELSKEQEDAVERLTKPLGFTFNDVFLNELEEIEKRWAQIDPHGTQRQLSNEQRPTANHGLVGVGFSGGGIRSASINLGITQVLHSHGLFNHVDYMSTVSGGGYLGASISTLMRSRTSLTSEIEGTVAVYTEQLRSEIAGTVQIEKGERDQFVVIKPSGEEEQERRYRFPMNARLQVRSGDTVDHHGWLISHRGGTSTAASETTPTATPDTGDQIVVVTSINRTESRTYRFASGTPLNVVDGENVSAGKPLLKPRTSHGTSEISGTVSVETTDSGEQIVKVQGTQRNQRREYRFSKFEQLIVTTGTPVNANQALVQRINSLGSRFHWRVPPSAFLREMSGKLDGKHRWVNVSDGGHIENLATIELLRRRCKFIIIGDGEADPVHTFNGLATLKRCAYIDLGIEIQIDLDALRLRTCASENEKSTVCEKHCAIGQITYPKRDKADKPEIGYLLYMKSSFTGDEDEVIQEYRHRNPAFPHQTTADQFFDEGQFEAYRALGQHIAEDAIKALTAGGDDGKKMESFSDLEKSFKNMWDKTREPQGKSPQKKAAKRPAKE